MNWFGPVVRYLFFQKDRFITLVDCNYTSPNKYHFTMLVSLSAELIDMYSAGFLISFFSFPYRLFFFFSAHNVPLSHIPSYVHNFASLTVPSW